MDELKKGGYDMGIVLILITLLLKLITYPMVKKSYMSSAKILLGSIDDFLHRWDVVIVDYSIDGEIGLVLVSSRVHNSSLTQKR